MKWVFITTILGLAITFAMYAVVTYVAVHFIAKYW